MRATHEILFLPWADSVKTIEVGPVKFVPRPQFAVSNRAAQTMLDRIFRRHLDHYGRPVKTITVVDRRNPLAIVSTGERNRVRRAVDALLFAVISPSVQAAVTANSRNLAPPTADAYQLVSQRFQLGENTIAVRVGGSIHAGRIDRLTIHQPWDMGGAGGFPDEDLLSALGALLVSREHARTRDRIFRSLEWYRLAHTVGDGSSEFSRAVMMATAFEVLLSIPREKKTSNFISEIESRVGRARTLKRTAPDFLGKNRNHSLPGWWAHDFYDLRSRVVHGDSLSLAKLRYSRWLTHLIVADLVFWQCVVKELYSLGFLGCSIRKLSQQYDRLTPGRSAGSHEQDLIDMYLHFKDVHQALGWLRKPRRAK